MGVLVYYGNNFLWEVVGNHVVEKPKDNYEIVLYLFDSGLFGLYGGEGRELLSRYPYLLMLMKIWSGSW